jgi:hypothetical protein
MKSVIAALLCVVSVSARSISDIISELKELDQKIEVLENLLGTGYSDELVDDEPVEFDERANYLGGIKLLHTWQVSSCSTSLVRFSFAP